MVGREAEDLPAVPIQSITAYKVVEDSWRRCDDDMAAATQPTPVPVGWVNGGSGEEGGQPTGGCPYKM